MWKLFTSQRLFTRCFVILAVNVLLSTQVLASNFNETLKKAQQGDAQAQYEVAEVYYFGVGASKEDAKALEWYQKAAEQGHVKAQNALARIYISGEGAAVNIKAALACLAKGVQQGDVDSIYYLASLFEEGKGVVQSFSRAKYWLEQGMKQKDGFMTYQLGSFYHYGLGVEEDKSQALTLYEQSLLYDANADELALMALRGILLVYVEEDEKAPLNLEKIYFWSEVVRLFHEEWLLELIPDEMKQVQTLSSERRQALAKDAEVFYQQTQENSKRGVKQEAG